MNGLKQKIELMTLGQHVPIIPNLSFFEPITNEIGKILRIETTGIYNSNYLNNNNKTKKTT